MTVVTKMHVTLCIYALLSLLVNQARLAGSSAIGAPCPNKGGSIYMDNEELTDFPPELRNINCSRLYFDNNHFISLINGRCITCDFLSFNHNKLEVLTTLMLSGFPNIRHLSVNYNFIKWVEGDVLTGLKRLDIENNPPVDIPWSHAAVGQKFSLNGTTILCDCAVGAGVNMLTAPQCEGDQVNKILERLQCPAKAPDGTIPTSQRPTTDLEVASEAHTFSDTYHIPAWVIWVIVLLVLLVLALLFFVIVCSYRYREEIDAKDGRRMRRRIEQMPWFTAGGSTGEQGVEGSKTTLTPAPTDTASTPLTNG